MRRKKGLPSHIDFMDQAISLSKLNLKTNHGGPFGAVIVKNGKIIAAEPNSVTKSNDPTAHAEVNAIRTACKKIKSAELEGCIMYTSCEPCPMCTSAIYWAKISAVYYGNTKTDAEWAGFGDTFITDELLKPINDRHIKFERMGASNAIQAFEDWVNKSSQEKDEIKNGSL